MSEKLGPLVEILQFSRMSIERMIREVYVRRQLRILLHIVFWIGLFGVQRYLASISFNNYKSFPDAMVTLLIATGTACIMLFYYPFVYWVLPRFFYAKRFIIGTILSLLLINCYAFADTLVEEFIINPCTT